ncbi:unnamed protein product [Adineta ricciae]|uniref:Uncharacterized protein n=1 Tax=Adineta ricciae TaxID=249248 RepID=A0A815YN18_ADIRI|nr:unnamed protein product [Adineta ricciae]
MESGDKSSIHENSSDETVLLLHRLNIPLNCLDNSHSRQHYIEEYSAKYSKAKYLLGNARKKQRKIIMTYYNEKERPEQDFERLQSVKASLLEENEKIKKFKEALKRKLLLYQQRIQFLKDAEFSSTKEIEQLKNNTPTICTDISSDSPMIDDSLHHLLDDSYPYSSDDHQTDLFHFTTQDSLSNPQTAWFQALKHYYEFFDSSPSTGHVRLISMIVMISLAILLIIFINDLLEYFLVYLTKSPTFSSIDSTLPSSSSSFFTNFLSNIYHHITSWFLSVFHWFESSSIY